MAESEDLSSGQLPLKGVVLCCTSLPQDVRTNLSDAALQMGATHKLDLTSDVTHLIVGSISTPKYRYVAKDRPDIKVLQPSWIEAVRKSWMEGIDVDVEALEREHKTPPFKDLQICVTGFQDVVQRNDIAHTAESHGAAYHGDLTKDVSHLIAQKPEGAKYTAAKQWNLHVVSLKWFEDSILRGMALDEKLYDPVLPLEEQGIGAFRRFPNQRTSLGKRKSDGESQDAARKKLRRTASTRLESQSQDMWQDISAHSTSSRQMEADQWNDNEDSSKSHVSETTLKVQKEQKTVHQPDRPGAQQTDAPSGLFTGSYVLLHGFDRNRTSLLRKYLVPNGAEVVESPKDLEDASLNPMFTMRYLLVPHAQSSPPSPAPDVPPGTVVATEWWVERCIHYKQLLDPNTDALSRPLNDVAISGFGKVSISTTGFAGVDLRQVAESVRLMGATYLEKIIPSSTVLISGSAPIRKEKAFYAQKHRIPIVTTGWLWACLDSKKQVPFEDFLLPVAILDAKDFPAEPSTSSPAPSDVQQGIAKNTGKAKDPSAVKRLSNTRSRHATPTLSLQASKKAPAVSAPKPRPIVHEDEDDDESHSFQIDVPPAETNSAVPHKSSRPLQEISPNLSPKKTSDLTNGKSDELSSKLEAPPKAALSVESPLKPASPPRSPARAPIETEDASAQAHAPAQNLNADLAELLNRKAASRPNSASSRSPEKRKKRPLGRALSGISNRSNSDNHSPALAAEEAEVSEADGYSTTKEAPLPPSTQIGYETPEAEAHRLQMSKKMGAKLNDDHGLTRLASVGTVKDTSLTSQSNASTRLRGKQRGK